MMGSGNHSPADDAGNARGSNMVNKINDYLYVIQVRLPENPLRSLNSYVICTPKRNLLIDTGFNQPECLADLRQGIAELNLDMTKTDVLATHFHADHCGLIDKIVEPGRSVFIGEIDKQMLQESRGNPEYWLNMMRRYQQEGFPRAILDEAARTNPARVFAVKRMVEMTPLKDGDVLTIGDVELRCILTPGHTPGHICLYNERDKLMILGDHILFDITPNITTWPTLPNSLGSYLQSLKKIRPYDVVLPLPGHRGCTCAMTERIEQLLIHHEKRLDEALRIIREQPGLSAYEIAGRMTWSIRARNWDEFPSPQKWFAMGETLSHLYYLIDAQAIGSESQGEHLCYFAKI
jgi:glyoxylase-like metal-dependent hydrolase (beta-lactamase superfamily II)